MKDAIKTAKKQFKNCSWCGDAGEALPARHVAPLFAEINRLRNALADREAKVLQQSKTIEQYRHRIGALECTNGVLQDFKTHYSDMAKSLGFDSISDMAVKAKSLRLDLGLTEISLDHKTTLLDSCEKALAERDKKSVQLKKQVIEILSGVRAAKIAVNVMRRAGVFSTNYLDAKMAGQVVQWLDESINYDSTEEGLKDD
jgi:hypothetical protein